MILRALDSPCRGGSPQTDRCGGLGRIRQPNGFRRRGGRGDPAPFSNFALRRKASLEQPGVLSADHRTQVGPAHELFSISGAIQGLDVPIEPIRSSPSSEPRQKPLRMTTATSIATTVTMTPRLKGPTIRPKFWDRFIREQDCPILRGRYAPVPDIGTIHSMDAPQVEHLEGLG